LNLILEGLIAAAAQFPEHRLPELFCGYARDEGMLVPYPVACSPQAWAAGTAFVMLHVMLGLQPDADKEEILITPALPKGINRLKAQRLRVGKGELDLSLYKEDGKVHVAVGRNTTGWKVVINHGMVS
jgi:glycogen debranching enzyme